MMMKKRSRGVTPVLNDENILVKIFSFLWFHDFPKIAIVDCVFNAAVKSDVFQQQVLNRIFKSLIMCPDVHILSTSQNMLEIVRRLTAMPARMDVHAALQSHGSRNVRVCPLHSTPSSPCFLYGGRAHKNVVFVADSHFPCLPRSTVRERDKMGTLAGLGICKSLAPFTNVTKVKEHNHAVSMTCIAYFEVDFKPLRGQGTDADDDSAGHISLGLASPLFPLKKRRLGLDPSSFGYHCDGRFYHGSKDVAKPGPAFQHGDTVGCGIIYPPLAPGKIFFTRNGGLVEAIDVGDEILSAPWFPAVCCDAHAHFRYNFGLSEAFKFDVKSFERQQIADCTADLGPDYRNVVRAQFSLGGGHVHPIVRDPHWTPVPLDMLTDDGDRLSSSLYYPHSTSPFHRALADKSLGHEERHLKSLGHEERHLKSLGHEERHLKSPHWQRAVHVSPHISAFSASWPRRGEDHDATGLAALAAHAQSASPSRRDPLLHEGSEPGDQESRSSTKRRSERQDTQCGEGSGAERRGGKWLKQSVVHDADYLGDGVGVGVGETESDAVTDPSTVTAIRAVGKVEGGPGSRSGGVGRSEWICMSSLSAVGHGGHGGSGMESSLSSTADADADAYSVGSSDSSGLQAVKGSGGDLMGRERALVVTEAHGLLVGARMPSLFLSALMQEAMKREFMLLHKFVAGSSDASWEEEEEESSDTGDEESDDNDTSAGPPPTMRSPRAQTAGFRQPHNTTTTNSIGYHQYAKVIDSTSTMATMSPLLASRQSTALSTHTNASSAVWPNAWLVDERGPQKAMAPDSAVNSRPKIHIGSPLASAAAGISAHSLGPAPGPGPGPTLNEFSAPVGSSRKGSRPITSPGPEEVLVCRDRGREIKDKDREQGFGGWAQIAPLPLPRMGHEQGSVEVRARARAQQHAPSPPDCGPSSRPPMAMATAGSTGSSSASSASSASSTAPTLSYAPLSRGGGRSLFQSPPPSPAHSQSHPQAHALGSPSPFRQSLPSSTSALALQSLDHAHVHGHGHAHGRARTRSRSGEDDDDDIGSGGLSDGSGATILSLRVHNDLDNFSIETCGRDDEYDSLDDVGPFGVLGLARAQKFKGRHVSDGGALFVGLSEAGSVLGEQHNELVERAERNRAMAFGDDDDEYGSEDERSIATSLFVEVASVDEGGSYIGYGAASESDDDLGDPLPPLGGSVDGSGAFHCPAPSPFHYTHHQSELHPDVDRAYGRGTRWPSEFDAIAAGHSSSARFPENYVATSSSRLCAAGGIGVDTTDAFFHTSSGGSGGSTVSTGTGGGGGGDGGGSGSTGRGQNHRNSWDKADGDILADGGDGYDGASERGRCETDGVEDDIGDDGEFEEETEERRAWYPLGGPRGSDWATARDRGSSAPGPPQAFSQGSGSLQRPLSGAGSAMGSPSGVYMAAASLGTGGAGGASGPSQVFSSSPLDLVLRGAPAGSLGQLLSTSFSGVATATAGADQYSFSGGSSISTCSSRSTRLRHARRRHRRANGGR